MRYRDQVSLRQFREQEAAIAAAQEEERLRPVREAEDGLKKSATELAVKLREIALSEPIERYDETALAGVPRSDHDPGIEAALKAGKQWAATEPRYTALSSEQRTEVGEMLHAFIRRNKLDALQIASWQTAFRCLYHVGAIPEPTPEQQPETAQPEPEAILTTQPAPEMFDGWDIATGEPKRYTRRQVDSMDSLTYRKAFRLIGDRTPRFIDPRTN